MSCPDCFRGGVSTNHPTGIETIIHGLPTYVAQPNEGVTPKGIIVFITDAFGWKFVNNRVLADHYAKKGGFLVYCPDFMNGNAMDPRIIAIIDKITTPTSWFNAIVYKPIYVFQILIMALPWKFKTGIPATHPAIVSFIQSLRSSVPQFPTKDLKIGVAGFCWGGKHAILLSHNTPSSHIARHESQGNSNSNSDTSQRLIECIFTAHPSYLDIPNDIEGIKVPISIAVGDQDATLKMPKLEEIKGVLEGKKEVESEVKVYEGARHGFAVRNLPEDEKEVINAEGAEGQALEWFGRWLS